MSITATLFVQMIVFLILAWFTMKFIWPPITPRSTSAPTKIADGLSAADKAKAELASANKRIEQRDADARAPTPAQRLADAERRGQSMIDEAKARASEEGAKIVAAAQAEAEQEVVRGARCAARSGCRARGAGAEQILRREVERAVHGDLLNQLKAGL